MHHLDTNIVVAHLRGNSAVSEHINARLPEVAISTMVLAELLYGARASARPTRNIEHIRRFVDTVHVLGFDGACAEAYSHIRFALRRQGRPGGETDTLIAAVAVAHEAVLVTNTPSTSSRWKAYPWRTG